jgi:hypothetical protein
MANPSEARPPTTGLAASPDGVFARHDCAVTRRIAGETVIVPVRQDVADLDSIYTLNETGTFLWDLMDGRLTVAALIEALVAEFEVTPEAAAADVAALVATLCDEGLLRPVP